MKKNTIDQKTTPSLGAQTAKKTALLTALVTFLVLMICGLVLRQYELDQRNATAISLSKAIADTALADTSLSMDETILKVSDLFLIDAVLGVKLIEGETVPISVGDTLIDFPDLNSNLTEQITFQNDTQEVDVAFKLTPTMSFDWFVIRLDSSKIMKPAIMGTLISWVIAPITGVIIFLAGLFIIKRAYLEPMSKLETFFTDNDGHFYLKEMSASDLNRKDQWGHISRQIEKSRKIIKDDKIRLESQAAFLNETPYPLLRCSVNRKVLYANSAARALDPLFGDETLEFVSPAMSEIVRKAFYDTKEIHADIRLGDYIMTFRAVPVLDSGYVNLYGEHSRKEVK